MVAVRNASSDDNAAGLEAFLIKAGAKERVKIEKHLAACEAEPHPGHGRLFRRLLSDLGTLAPLGVQSMGKSWRFFVADGKYRMQVFALEDAENGTLLIYMPDVLADAIKAGVLSKTKVAREFGVKGSKEPLIVDALDNANTPQPLPHVKAMLGWNRKALRVTLSTADDNLNLAAATAQLCALASKGWGKAAVATT